FGGNARASSKRGPGTDPAARPGDVTHQPVFTIATPERRARKSRWSGPVARGGERRRSYSSLRDEPLYAPDMHTYARLHAFHLPKGQAPGRDDPQHRERRGQPGAARIALTARRGALAVRDGDVRESKAPGPSRSRGDPDGDRERRARRPSAAVMDALCRAT